MTEQLAILGGEPIRKETLPPYNTIGNEEKNEVLKVLEKGELSGFVAGNTENFWGGEYVKKLENNFKSYFNVKYAVAVNSATSGLHAVLSATGIGPGDEIITSPYTQAASATTALFCGAIPIFADIEEDTFCLDPKSVEKLISPNTKVIVAVNIFGMAANLEALKNIAIKHNLFLIEDNAQAPGAKYNSKYTGTIGDAGVFSFNRHKTIQCGEGGVIITNNEKLATKAALMRNHGELTVDGMEMNDIVNTVGVNYRMTEMEAAVANVQFKKLESLNDYRIKLADHLTSKLQKISGISTPKIRENCTHVYYFYVMLYDQNITKVPRELFVKAINAEGFPLRAGYVRPIYLEPLYQKKICFGKSGFPFSYNNRNDEISYNEGICPVTERLHNEKLMLTNFIFPPLTINDIEKFAYAFEKVLSNKEKLLNKIS